MAAPSDVDIANSALFKIGDSPIQSFAEESRRARVVTTLYPAKRRELLMRYRWTFAMSRAALAPLAAAPAFGFTFQFNLPADCLAVVGIFDQSESLRNYTSSKEAYKIEGRRLLFVDNAVNIYYVADVEDTSKFDPLFAEALALRLATDLVYALSTGQSRSPQIERDFRDTLRVAKQQNAIQSTPEIIEADEYLSARYSDRGGDEFLRAGPILV